MPARIRGNVLGQSSESAVHSINGVFNGSTVSLYVAQVWIVYGDGSLGYTVAEFDTFTRHKVKLDRNVSVKKINKNNNTQSAFFSSHC